MLAPPLASTVSSVMSLGFTARETIPIVFFGFLICSVVITRKPKNTFLFIFCVVDKGAFPHTGTRLGQLRRD